MPAIDDKGRNKAIYQNQLKVAEYFWFDPFDPDPDVWAGFELRCGGYEPIVPDEQDRLICRPLELALVCWWGFYAGVEAVWLRWATLERELLPTDREALTVESHRAEAEVRRIAAAAVEVGPVTAAAGRS